MASNINNNQLKTLLYTQLKGYIDELGLAPSAVVSTMASLVSDRDGACRALDSLEEAAAYLQRDESIQ